MAGDEQSRAEESALPSIVEYDHVLRAMAEQGLLCQYYNSGAFGFGKGVPIR